MQISYPCKLPHLISLSVVLDVATLWQHPNSLQSMLFLLTSHNTHWHKARMLRSCIYIIISPFVVFALSFWNYLLLSDCLISPIYLLALHSWATLLPAFFCFLPSILKVRGGGGACVLRGYLSPIFLILVKCELAHAKLLEQLSSLFLIN